MQFPFPITPEDAGSGKLISYVSLRAGAGASTLACLHALSLIEKGDTALVDFNPESKVRTYMGLPADVSSASILDFNGVISATDIEKAGEKVSSGLFVVPGIIRLTDVSQVDAALQMNTNRLLKQRFTYTIAALGSLNSDCWASLIVSDLIFVVATPNRTDIDACRECLGFLDRLGCLGRTKIILNQQGMPGCMAQEDAETWFKPDATIMFDKTLRLDCNRRKMATKPLYSKTFAQLMQTPVISGTIDEFLLGSLATRAGMIGTVAEEQTEGTSQKINNLPISRENYNILREQVRTVVREQFTMDETSPSNARSSVIKSRFNNLAYKVITDNGTTVDEQDKPDVISRMFNDILGYGVMEPYFMDPEVTEIKVNGTHIEVEKKGIEVPVDEHFENIEEVLDLVRRMITTTGRRIDNAEPEVNARLHDGSRLICQIEPVAVDGALVTIRRFRQDITATSLIKGGSTSREAMDFLKAAAKTRSNMLIAGGTSSGKTTWLNILAGYIRDDLSIVTIEDPAELQLQHPKVRRLEARPANMEGKGEYTLSDGVKASLRMAPDIVILGEVRGKEAFDMLQAMNTGHKGSMGTLHSNSAKDSIGRLGSMVAQAGMDIPHDAILDQIADAIDIIIYVKQDSEGKRRLDHIIEIEGRLKAADHRTIEVVTNPLFEYNESRETWDWVADHFSRAELFEKVGGWICPK